MGVLKELLARLLCAVGVPALARRLRSRRLAILMFHGVESEPLSPPCDWVIDTATLRRNLEYVRRHFTVLPLAEALGRLDDGTLPKCAVAVTFDDGTRNLLTHAAPLLRELNVPAAVFLATGPMGTDELLWPDRMWTSFAQTTRTEVDLTSLGLGVRPLRRIEDRVAARDAAMSRLKGLPDARRVEEVESLVAALGAEFDGRGGPFTMLSWDEARELASGGLVSLHPHSVTHPILARCDDHAVDAEVSGSCRAVELNTGLAPTIFAYPNGNPRDYDGRTREALRRNGIRWSLSTINGIADQHSDPLALPRLGFKTDQSFSVVKLKLSGFGPPRRRRRATVGEDASRAEVGSGVGV